MGTEAFSSLLYRHRPFDFRVRYRAASLELHNSSTFGNLRSFPTIRSWWLCHHYAKERRCRRCQGHQAPRILTKTWRKHHFQVVNGSNWENVFAAVQTAYHRYLYVESIYMGCCMLKKRKRTSSASTNVNRMRQSWHNPTTVWEGTYLFRFWSYSPRLCSFQNRPAVWKQLTSLPFRAVEPAVVLVKSKGPPQNQSPHQETHHNLPSWCPSRSRRRERHPQIASRNLANNHIKHLQSLQGGERGLPSELIQNRASILGERIAQPRLLHLGEELIHLDGSLIDDGDIVGDALVHAADHVEFVVDLVQLGLGIEDGLPHPHLLVGLQQVVHIEARQQVVDDGAHLLEVVA
ncbi:hypothetical protein GE09DRAFT_637134 [Coniochaeta sp. 2T2.1]|nr:hypothetical protein GE09DRAFT_637134 [Coniochaeta sp. 2T2.1]